MLQALKSQMAGDQSKELKFQYVNWRNEVSIRTVIPLEIWFGQTEWHPQQQWFIKAIDLEKGVERDFAMKDMRFHEITD